jgi:hypothetical protein
LFMISHTVTKKSCQCLCVRFRAPFMEWQVLIFYGGRKKTRM